MLHGDTISMADILLRLGQNWAKWNRRVDRKRAKGKELTEEEDEAYHDHPFIPLCRRLQELSGISCETIQRAAISRFCDQTDVVISLRALDGDGRSRSLVKKLFVEWPELTSKLIPDGNMQPGVLNSDQNGATPENETTGSKRSRSKRSTNRGDAQAKLIAALTEHHQYASGGCLNPCPIGINKLAAAAEVSSSTASVFFNATFNDRKSGGHARYRAICLDVSRLVTSLKVLNNEFAPHHLFGRAPSDEVEIDNDD